MPNLYQVNIHEAKTQLSQLLQRVEEGQEICIARAGKPVAILKAIDNSSRQLAGTWSGQVTIGEDFDALPKELRAAFQGETI